MKKLAALAIVLGLSLVAATTALAANGYSLFGDATLVSPGNNSMQAVQMVSDTDPGFGGVNFTIPSGTTFADLQTLSTDFNVTEGACGGGSPRFQVKVLDENNQVKNIFVYLGEQPNYTCTPDVWQNSGDLLQTGRFVDTSQLTGGTFYDPYDTALTKYGSLTVTSVQLVTDAGWMFGNNQTVLADNVVINSSTYSFEPSKNEAKEMCKKNGYQSFNGQNGMPGPFKNQGQCVSYMNHNVQ